MLVLVAHLRPVPVLAFRRADREPGPVLGLVAVEPDRGLVVLVAWVLVLVLVLALVVVVARKPA